MENRKRVPQTVQTDSAWSGRRFLTWVVGILLIVVLCVFGRGILALAARHLASREMDVWAISAAQQWLARAARLDSESGMTDWMEAVCYRRLDQMDRWREALQSAERKGAPAARIQLEIQLGRIRSGEQMVEDEPRVDPLVEAGASLHDVMATFVYGYLARGAWDKARGVLEEWEAAYPNEAHVAYMRGVYLHLLGESVPAMSYFEEAVARQPDHEPARRAIAELSTTAHLLHRAFDHYRELAVRSPTNPDAKLGLAEVLRKLGRTSDARKLLESLSSQPEPSSKVALEMGHIELESGNYQEAERWFARVDFDAVDDMEILSAAATAFAFNGNATRAEWLFARRAAKMSRSARMHDLQVQLSIDPNDKQAVVEARSLSAPLAVQPGKMRGNGTEPSAKDDQENAAKSGSDLYALHCSACHGTNGRGDGRAAWHLFPRPRDVRRGRFRIVSTFNGVPTLEDLKAVTKRGMPGTSMPPFEELREDEHELLAQEVLRLHREGVRDEFTEMLKSEEEEIDEDTVREVVDDSTTPGEVHSVPEIGAPGPRAIANGKDAYFRQGCDKCHGDDGVGASDTPLFNEEGRPTRARDLVHEPFKGGHDAESFYLRIALGMPGTPHPASWTLPEDQLIDLVHYCRWLSQEPKRVLTNHERSLLASGRAYLSRLAND